MSEVEICCVCRNVPPQQKELIVVYGKAGNNSLARVCGDVFPEKFTDLLKSSKKRNVVCSTCRFTIRQFYVLWQIVDDTCSTLREDDGYEDETSQIDDDQHINETHTPVTPCINSSQTIEDFTISSSSTGLVEGGNDDSLSIKLEPVNVSSNKLDVYNTDLHPPLQWFVNNSQDGASCSRNDTSSAIQGSSQQSQAWKAKQYIYKGRKRKCLNLEERVDVVRRHMTGESVVSLCKAFNCGKSQIYVILKEQQSIMEAWQHGGSANSHHKYINRRLMYPEVDTEVWEWYQNCRSQQIAVTGTMVQDKSRVIALKYGYDEFSASSGWLDSFKERHNITFR